MVFGRIKRTLKRINGPVIRGTQFVLLHSLLFLLYYIAFTLSRLLMTVLARRLLFNRAPRRPTEDTFWRKAEGYELDAERLTRQS